MKIRQKPLPGLGPLYDAFVTSLPFISAIQFLTILTLFYSNLSPTLLSLFPWMTFTKFIVGVILIMAGIMVLVYKFLIPSIWTFRGTQLYGFQSTLMEEIRILRKEIQELKEEKKKDE